MTSISEKPENIKYVLEQAGGLENLCILSQSLRAQLLSSGRQQNLAEASDVECSAGGGQL